MDLKLKENESKMTEYGNSINDLPDPCPRCGQRVGTIERTGKQLKPNAMYSAAECEYTLCSSCQYVYSYCF